jgi:hypothetical protein
MRNAARNSLALWLCVPTLLGAQRQVAPDSARPAYESLRYKEDWSRRYYGDFLDPLKHIDLPGDAWISLGGSARYRGERADNFLGGGTGTRDDAYGLVRAYLHADIHGSFGTRVFLEGRNARAPGRTLPGGERTSDRDDLDWGNLFAEVTRGFPGSRAVARYGRQELLFGRERIVSPSDWSNVRRSFEGTVVEIQQQAMELTAMYLHPIVVSQTDQNLPDNRTAFYGGYLAWRRTPPNVFEAYVLDKRIDMNGAVRRAHRTMIGARIVQPLIAHWKAEIEAGVQFGSKGDTSISASMVATDFTRAWKGRWSPSITLGADRSSGTGAGKSAQSGTWDVFYALAHRYVGYADVLGRRNVTELRAVAQAAPASTLRLCASGHIFRRTSADDAMYDAGGDVARASIPGASMELGTELDVTAQWRLQRHLRIDGGAAVFTPGQFMKDTGAAQQYTWAFASLTAIF